jgi:hypothetical protein
MATTTNYSWSTPDDTALVKDGAAAIRSLGTAIDTTVFNNAGAAIAKTIVDAKGDIIAATAADTVSRLAVGANDTVLTADSTAATGLKWATAASGGMTLLSTTTLSGTSTTISGIAGTYKSLVGFIYGINFSANDYLIVNPNSTAATSTTGIFNSNLFQYATDSWYLTSAGDYIQSANTNNSFSFTIDNYASSTNYKPVSWQGSFTSNVARSIIGGGGFRSNTAITSLQIKNDSATTFNAGTLLLYGVN